MVRPILQPIFQIVDNDQMAGKSQKETTKLASRQLQTRPRRHIAAVVLDLAPQPRPDSASSATLLLGSAGGRRGDMASEDVGGKSRGDTAVTTIVNLAEEAKLAREGVKAPGHQILTICKSLVAGGSAGGV